MPNFAVAGFQTKRDIRHRSLDFVLFTGPDDMLFLASDGSVIQASIKDLGLLNVCYMYLLSHTL